MRVNPNSYDETSKAFHIGKYAMNNLVTSYLIKQATLCKSLDTGLNGLRKLQAKDDTMPKPIKFGNTRQSPVFYDSAEIEAWLESKRAARLPQAPTEAGV